MKSVVQMIELLNSSLSDEYKHFHFYINAAMRVQGLHRNQIRQLLLAEAASEMTHVSEFGDLIVGLGGIPTTSVNGFRNDLTDVKSILQYACEMEDEVVANYIGYKKEAQELGGVHGGVIEIFLDNQILQSRTDSDNLRSMIKGM